MTTNGNSGPAEPLLQIRGLRIEGQSQEIWQEIVKGIDLTLQRGEILGLIGESGAGKSTIGLAALAFARGGCRITGGEVIFDGEDLLKLPERRRRAYRGKRIAYVAQSAAAAFNPAHRLIDQYIETAVTHGVMSEKQARQEAVELYRQLQLPDPETFGQRYPHQVSGGQLQRAMVATAMACKPDLLVFDEPTTALDVTTQIEVLAAIKDTVRKYDTAAIYITHDLAVVAQLADRIMVLRYGELVEEGNTRELLENPRKSYTRKLLAVRGLRKDEERGETSLLTISNISAAYARSAMVLRDVSIRVPEGRTVAVVGESGSGKSTLARVITGLLPPLEGSISLRDQVLPATLSARNKDTLRRVQMIYQLPDTALNPRQRVRDIIGRPLQFYLGLTGRKRRERVKELLEMTELDERYLDRYPAELSGGQKQRVCIARALAAEPDLIICDEVTSALDQLVAEHVLRLLLRLQRELKVSYLFITHDLATVNAIADDVVVMCEGRIVEQGPKTEVFTPPHEDYTQILLDSVPEMDPDWLDRVLEERKTVPAA
ncbi:ABC transporter ATP-binding protein [Ferruginivarius sediminum]|uniref:ABC transporter ATP-binding protein n=1 Tax=Ferruginivarius sediminum TaxID=2661937 RepID=A0A369T901_9PROT|nr:ABC transporter ATP-binding protein [Ferruginivarius sediminum]RDD60954.1 ABC transporter ATP-binding protein [Ferruginivarius sediminum]